jgi:hypothetical protein
MPERTHARDTTPAPARDRQIATQPATAGPARVELAARWARYHARELAGVGLPIAPAVAVSPWFGTVSGVVVVWWVVAEYRARRKPGGGDGQ